MLAIVLVGVEEFCIIYGGLYSFDFVVVYRLGKGWCFVGSFACGLC